MARIATITLNPTIDGASEAEIVNHTHKIRTTQERFDPGGGGINVARVLAQLGEDTEAVYLAGGVTGPLLSELLQRINLAHRPIPIDGDTRVSLAVHERQSGKEYRFVPRGPSISQDEAQRCLDVIATIECSWLVISGSLPPGVPDDFYCRIVEIARARDIPVVLDTSGGALKATLAQGGIRLVKPSLGEIQQLAGHPLSDQKQIIEVAQSVVTSGGAETVVVTMGHKGALLVEAGQAIVAPALEVQARSAVGAGDSFVAGMTFGLAQDWESKRAFQLGLAAGTAAVLTPGTDLCHRDDIERVAALFGIADLLEGQVV